MRKKIGDMLNDEKSVNFINSSKALAISTQLRKDCQTVQTLYQTRINFRFLSYTFLSLGWFM